MKQAEKFKNFVEYWSQKSNKEILCRLYALTRYAERIDRFFENPYCGEYEELSAFDDYVRHCVFIKRKE